MQIPVLFLKSHVDAFTRGDGVTVGAHETKVQARAAPPRRPGGPGEGEIGDHEHQTYGVHFRPGDKAKDREGNTHTVVEHNGAGVRTMGGGSFHPTKLTKVDTPAAAPARRGSAPIQQKGAPPVDGVAQLSPAAKVAAKRKELAARKPALDPHPNVIGKAENEKEHSFDFGGKSYRATGKEGHSFHDSTPVAEHESDDGHRVWKDGQGRVHADSAEEAKKARGGK